MSRAHEAGRGRLALLALLALPGGGCCRRKPPPAPLPPVASAPASSAPRLASAPVAELAREPLWADPAVPLRGSIQRLAHPPSGSFVRPAAATTALTFVPHQATHAVAAADGSVIVLASTGLWLHASATGPRLARLAPAPIAALALSNDGRTLAFVRARDDERRGELRVISLPGRTVVATIAGVDAPVRMRFSPDDRSLVLASTAADSVSRVDLATRRVVRFDADTDVNDAIALPGPDGLVAIASDDDEAVVLDPVRRTRRFSSHEPTKHYKGIPVPLFAWNPGLLLPVEVGTTHAFAFLRDQHAVAFDAATGALWAGGDDNLVWRFDGVLTGTATLTPPLEMNGNVREILCVPAAGRSDASIVVALDTLSVHRFSARGVAEGTLAPSLWSLDSAPIRLAPAPDDGVLLAAGGALARWHPLTGRVEASAHYPLVPSDPRSDTVRDTLLTFGHSPVTLHRLALRAEAPDVATEIIGTVDLRSTPHLAAFRDGTRLLVGPGPTDGLRVVFLPPGGSPEPPLDPVGLGPPVAVAGTTGPDLVAILDSLGHVLEFSASRRSRLVGRLASPPPAGAGLSYHPTERRWVVQGSGPPLPLTPER